MTHTPQKNPSDLLEELARALSGKKTANGYDCKCPCHDDKKQSLSISIGDKHPIAWYCHGGCSKADVQKALEALVGPILTNNGAVVYMPGTAPEATYIYSKDGKRRDFEKLRYPGKGFRYRHKKDDKFIWEKPESAKQNPVLYFHAKLDRLRGQVPVIVCEGEKDCDRLNSILKDDYIAVTNDNGASGWKAPHGALLADCEIIVAEDNDKVGRERSRIISALGGFKHLLGVLRFSDEEVGEHGDVTDWLNRGASEYQLRERLRNGLGQPTLPTSKEKSKKPVTKEAPQEEIVALIYKCLGDVRKDLFTDKLLYRNSRTGSSWKSARNAEKIIKAAAKELSRISREDENGGLIYPGDSIEYNLADLESLLSPEVLFDIPEWDSVDRLDKMVKSLKLIGDSPFTHKHIKELLCDWISKMWERIDNPMIRNRIFLLTGPQNIGKDWWIDNLVGGFGRWNNNLYLGGYDHKDLQRQLNENISLTIPEFDRTARVEVQLLKDIVTKFHTDLRKPYDADSEQRPCRCSFISSCNIQDILRDSTGATRYIIIEVEKIAFNYPNSPADKLQIIAQGKALSQEKYRAGKDAEKRLSGLLDTLTPEALEDLVIEDWISEYSKLKTAHGLIDSEGATLSICRQTLSDIGKRYSIPLVRVQQILKVRGYRDRFGEDKVVAYLPCPKNSNRVLIDFD